jgi:hypothetical protein
VPLDLCRQAIVVLGAAWFLACVPGTRPAPTALALTTAFGCESDESPDELFSLNPKDVELRLEHVGPTPCAFQAVRLRLTLRNVSSQKLRYVPIDNFTTVFVIRKAGQEEVTCSPLVFESDELLGVTARADRNGRTRLFLDPGEQTSVSFAIALHSSKTPPDHRNQDTPIFSEAGGYKLRCRYLINEQKRTYIDAAVSIKVQEPPESDLKLLARIRQNGTLLRSMLLPIDRPSKQDMENLRDIVEKHGSSSYADYARFAIARHHLRGGPFRRQAAPDEEEMKAVETLRVLAARDFAYRPNAIVTLFTADATSRTKLGALLRSRFRDDLIWLEQVAPSLDEVEWARYRKHKGDE